MVSLRLKSAVHFAKEPGNPHRKELLAAHADIWAACDAGNARALEDALATHAAFLPQALDLRDDNGWTALHVAISWGAEECMALLLAAGANPDTRDHQGQNPQELAARLGYDSLARRIAPVPGAREVAARKATQAQLRAEREMITRGLPEDVAIPPCTLRANLRRVGRRCIA